MYEQVNRPKENNRSPVSNSVAQKKSKVKQCFWLVDNRHGQTHALSEDHGADKITHNKPLQRVIGAELETDGGLTYDPRTVNLVQGTVMGAILHSSGITTEIHAENPREINPALGAVTMEFAMGKYNEVHEHNISSMPRDAKELQIITSQIKAKPNDYLDHKGFNTETLRGTKAAIQINVSPNKGNTGKLAEFVGKGATISRQKPRGNGFNTVPSVDDGGSILARLIEIGKTCIRYDTINEEADSTFFTGIIPSLAIHITGLMSYNTRISLNGGLAGSHKNAFAAMPRFDLWALILTKLREAYGREEEMGDDVEIQDDTGMDHFKYAGLNLLNMVRLQEDDISRAVERSFQTPDFRVLIHDLDIDYSEVSEKPNEIAKNTVDQMSSMIKADAILVISRDPIYRIIEASILHDKTDTTKIPLSDAESPEGAYEIRSPFEGYVDTGEWGASLETYEKLLHSEGVRYLNGQ